MSHCFVMDDARGLGGGHLAPDLTSERGRRSPRRGQDCRRGTCLEDSDGKTVAAEQDLQDCIDAPPRAKSPQILVADNATSAWRRFHGRLGGLRRATWGRLLFRRSGQHG
jgi:hypothetical protein